MHKLHPPLARLLISICVCVTIPKLIVSSQDLSIPLKGVFLQVPNVNSKLDLEQKKMQVVCGVHHYGQLT